jgi:hypothetical protein
MRGECAIPESLPDSTLFRPPTNDFIMDYVPTHMGGKMIPKKSGKDVDEELKLRK